MGKKRSSISEAASEKKILQGRPPVFSPTLRNVMGEGVSRRWGLERSYLVVAIDALKGHQEFGWLLVVTSSRKYRRMSLLVELGRIYKLLADWVDPAYAIQFVHPYAQKLCDSKPSVKIAQKTLRDKRKSWQQIIEEYKKEQQENESDE